METDILREKIKPLREKRFRLRAIYLKLRKMERYKYWSDIALFNSVIFTMDDLDLPYSKSEVYALFKLIDKDDYPSELKNTLIHHATKNATSKSVFN